MELAYEPIIRRVTSIGSDLTTDEASALLDDLLRDVTRQIREMDFDWYEGHADGARMARDHIADEIEAQIGTNR